MKACNIYSKEKWLWNRFKVCVCMCSSVDFNSNELLTWLSLLPSGVRSHEVKEPLGWRGPLDTSQFSPLLKQSPKNNTLFALQQLLPNFGSLNMVPVQRDTQITGTGNWSGTGAGLWPPLWRQLDESMRCGDLALPYTLALHRQIYQTPSFCVGHNGMFYPTTVQVWKISAVPRTGLINVELFQSNPADKQLITIAKANDQTLPQVPQWVSEPFTGKGHRSMSRIPHL